MSATHRARGFTLTELLVALVVTAVVAAGSYALMAGQQQAFKSSAGDRALQEAARVALSEMGMNLRRAGYGVDPWLAIDFGPLSAAPFTNRSHPPGLPPTAATCTGSSAVTCRDSVAASDEIVFYTRSPAFSRRLSAAPSSTTLTFTEALGAAFQAGQILQVMCSGAADWAYVTVASTAADRTFVTLDTTFSGTFPYQQDKFGSGCFQSFSSAAVFRVDRFHYFIATYPDGASTARPYLMLDRGLKDSTNAPVVEPVAPDVEDLQFAYVFRSGTVVGTTSGTQLSNAAGGIDLAAAPPPYDADTTDARRNTNSPANIRAVRISVVVRSAVYDPKYTSASNPVPAAGNRASVTTAPAGYRRLLVETTEATRNLDSRGAFMPPLSANNGADGLNIGGG
jgi:type IV pilus assembly protein PilW